MSLGLCIPATLGPEVGAAVAPVVERLGYASFWTNDGGSPGLPVVAAAQRATSRIRLGVGAIPVDLRHADEIASTVGRLGIDLERTTVGVGAGRAAHPVVAVRAAVEGLRARLGDRSVVAVAALGPLMCRLAGEVADLALLNWMTPRRLRWARRRIAEGERRAGRAPRTVTVASYVRVAIGSDAGGRLGAEADRYARIAAYARSFDAMKVDPGSVGIAVGADADVRPALAPYLEVLDETIVRVLPTSDDAEGVLRIARAAIDRR